MHSSHPIVLYCRLSGNQAIVFVDAQCRKPVFYECNWFMEIRKTFSLDMGRGFTQCLCEKCSQVRDILTSYSKQWLNKVLLAHYIIKKKEIKEVKKKKVL